MVWVEAVNLTHSIRKEPSSFVNYKTHWFPQCTIKQYGIQLSFPPITPQQGKTQNNTRQGRHNSTQRKHNEMTKHTQHNKHKTKETCLVNKTLNNAREMQWNEIQCNTTEDNRTHQRIEMQWNSMQYNRRQQNTSQHTTIRYDAMWGRTQFTKNFLNISKKNLFSRNRSVAKRNISFHKFETRTNELIARCLFFPRIWDHKGINLLLDFWLFSRIEHPKRMNLLLKFWPLRRISDHTGVNVLPHFSYFWLLICMNILPDFWQFFTHFREERVAFITDFWLFWRLWDQKGVKLLLAFWPFRLLWKGVRGECLVRVLAIFANFRPEGNDFIVPYFWYFDEFKSRKDWTSFSIFSLAF